jgi:drug/metabolite transporter (DMT)-like permease
MLWIFLTLAAAPLQVARNAIKRSLLGDAGPWGATLVRFLFGLPFALAMFAVAARLTPGAQPHLSWRLAIAITAGGLAQVAATAALLVAMRHAGFAVATVMQQSSLPLAALAGWAFFGDRLSLAATAGVGLTTLGLAVLSWPRRDQVRGATLGTVLGLGSGLAFAVALNGFRQAGLALEPHHPLYAGVACVCLAQALQSTVMGLALAIWQPRALAAVARSWRQSLGAGFFGAAASACWFGALAMAPAGAVRAVGVVEAPIAAAAGHRLFKESLSLRQWAGGALAALGVVLTALNG